MPRHRATRATRLSSLVGAALVATGGTARAQAPSTPAPTATPSDSAFAAVQTRGADRRAMGVDQYTSAHRFDALPDGGRIELRRVADDSAGVARIRAHLRAIAAAFARGDFRTPAFVHMREVPGTAVMAARRSTIAYRVTDRPRGGEVRITTRDAEALAAVHAFIAFQRQDHRAGGVGTPRHAHPAGGHAHEHRHPPRR